MPSIHAENLGDLIATTLKDLGELKFTDLSVDLQDYPAAKRLLKQHRIVLESGTGIEWRVLMNHSDAAVNNGMFASDNVNVVDGMVVASSTWKHMTTNYAIERREIAMNRTPRKIVDLLTERRHMSMVALVELMEENFWKFPLVADTDTPLGIPYWVTKNNTEGFNGGIPSGHASVAGLSPTTYPRWNNWTAQYTAISKDDFVRKAREAAVYTKFMPPVDNPPASFNTGDNYNFFTNYTVIAALEESLEGQNESLGNDIASKDGMTMFRRTGVVDVPFLRNDTTDPFYGLNFGLLKNYVLRGEWLNETSIPITPGQHTVSSNHIDCTHNIITKDRRRHFVIAKDSTYVGV